jgi:hypothetical protein
MGWVNDALTELKASRWRAVAQLEIVGGVARTEYDQSGSWPKRNLTMRRSHQLPKFVTRGWPFVCIGLVVIVFLVKLLDLFNPYNRGMIAAWWDHSQGQYEIQALGFPDEWDGAYARLLNRRYGVSTTREAGPESPDDLVDFVSGYNRYSKSRLRAYFRKDIFAECEKDAKASWNGRGHIIDFGPIQF